MIIAVYTVATRFLKKFFQDDHFVSFTCDDIKVDIRPEHRCSTKKDSKISMKMVSLASSVSVSIHWDVFTIGMEHSILFVYCICEALAITMARAELWPATPTSPKFAFSFALLDWAESLLLEAQVSLKDFCNSLKFRCHSQVNKVGIFYGMYLQITLCV